MILHALCILCTSCMHAHDFQFLPASSDLRMKLMSLFSRRLAIGSKLEIVGEQKDRDIFHHANRKGTPMMMTRTASNNCDVLSRLGSEGTQAFSHSGLGGLQRIPTDLVWFRPEMLAL
jgi:hypothetical protein